MLRPHIREYTPAAPTSLPDPTVAPPDFQCQGFVPYQPKLERLPETSTTKLAYSMMMQFRPSQIQQYTITVLQQ